jgi:hypothetical protein
MKREDADLRGRTYVLEMLGTGASLSRSVSHRVEPAAGRVWTFVPDTLVLSSLKSFTARIDWGGEQGAVMDRLVLVIQERLADADSWLVVEDRFIEAPDHVSEVPGYFFIDSEVYYCVVGDSRAQSIDLALRHASRWPSLGFMGSGGVSVDLISGHRGTTDELAALAAHTRTVIVGAFDEESYLFWDLAGAV